MNLRSLFNIILQMKFQKINLTDVVKPDRKLVTIDGHFLQIYLKYDTHLLTTDTDGRFSQDDIQMLLYVIGRFELILGKP